MTSDKKEVFVPPYISISELQRFISLPRKYDPISTKDLQGAGFSYSNSYTLFGALKGLKVYDDNGKLLVREDLINLNAKDENTKRDAYKRIVNRAYEELMKEVLPEDATLERVQLYFELRGAANSISIKAARLFLWLASQAGIKTKETVGGEKATNSVTANHKPKIIEKKKEEQSKDQPKGKSQDEVLTNDQKILNAILKSIENYNGLPTPEILREARELSEKIKSEKNSKNRHDNNPEPS